MLYDYGNLFLEHTEPSLIDLLQELHPVCTSWYNIGLLLHIPHTTLDRFKQTYTDPLELMREMLKHWLDATTDPPPTWEAVITALKSPLVNKKNVAAQLESKYCSQYDMREVPSCHTQVEMKEGIIISTNFCSHLCIKRETRFNIPYIIKQVVCSEWSYQIKHHSSLCLHFLYRSS